jgi:integrase
MRISKQIGLPALTSPKALRHLFATSLQDGNVDPIIRCEIIGHSIGRSGGGLGMTANYTHTRPETKRRQLEQAQANRSAVRFARQWLRQAPSVKPVD